MKVLCPVPTDDLPQELVDFARRQIVNATMYQGDERRRDGRYHMMLPVRAVAVDADNRPVGEAFHSITRDISASAICLLHTDEIIGERLAIQLEVAGTEVIALIDNVWSKPLGPFYGAGGKFCEKLDRFPAS